MYDVNCVFNNAEGKIVEHQIEIIAKEKRLEREGK